MKPVILWFRRDLRLADNPALAAAVATGQPVLPVFILDDADAGPAAPGGASRWWLHHSLAALAESLRLRGVDLLLRQGAAAGILAGLVEATGATDIFWNRRYEAWAIRRDMAIKRDLEARGVRIHSSNAALLCEPWRLATGQGRPYQVFTPFFRALRAALQPVVPGPAPASIRPADPGLPGDRLAAWRLLPTGPDWAAGLRDTWTPGEAAATARLARFRDHALDDYHRRRDMPGQAGTSGLSPHLHFGEIGPRQIWHDVQGLTPMTGGAVTGGADRFLTEIGWREFSFHLLFHFPDLPEKPLKPAFAAFPWRHDPAARRAWQCGRTGYPIVDAGMRQLRETGWMHNRVRMIAASFLVKHLLIDWRDGQAWFWDNLVDADLANNAASWQWVAGCGADAAPFFRIFNPTRQGQTWDPAGDYIRRWLPELASLPASAIHTPWLAPRLTPRRSGAAKRPDYPPPVIELDKGRQRALAAFQAMKNGPAA